MKFDSRWLKILVMVATALMDGKITKEEAKAIVALVIDLFMSE